MENSQGNSIPGDMNEDGRLDAKDIEVFRNILEDQKLHPELFENLSPDLKAMLDVNGDGEINYEDLIAICKSVAREEHPGEAKVLADKFMALRNKVRSGNAS